jgi:membrane protease YdiL (CAAX protease family)
MSIQEKKEVVILENRLINNAFGIVFVVFAFLMVLYSIFGENSSISINSDLFLLIIIVILNLLGYVLILLPPMQTWIRNKIVTFPVFLVGLVVPLIVIISFLIISQMSELKDPNSGDTFIFVKYLVYIFIPVTIVSIRNSWFLKNKFNNKSIDVLIFIFLLVWTWWGIEFTGNFNLFPELVIGFGYFLNLIAFTTLAWCFFILSDYEIKRSFAQLFSISNMKTILVWMAILMIIIVPIGLVISFLTINFDNLLSKRVGAVGYLILAVIAVFLVQGVGEELLFRGFFFSILLSKMNILQEKTQNFFMFGLFGAVSLLIFLTPFVGLADTIQEGIVKDIPLEIIYPVISVIYFTIGLIFYLKTKDLVLTMVLWSSMLFGWAHFEDWRYLIFATIAGIGYCQTFRKTNNLFAASALHMLVDVIWGAVLS